VAFLLQSHPGTITELSEERHFYWMPVKGRLPARVESCDFGFLRGAEKLFDRRRRQPCLSGLLCTRAARSEGIRVGAGFGQTWR